MGFFATYLFSGGTWTEIEPDQEPHEPAVAEPWLYVDIHDSDIATVMYAPAGPASGIAFLGVTPRTYFEDAAASRAVEDATRERVGEQRPREVEREAAEEEAARERRRALAPQQAPVSRASQPARVAPAARPVTVARVQPMRPAAPAATGVRRAVRVRASTTASRRRASLWSTSLYLESARAGWNSTIGG